MADELNKFIEPVNITVRPSNLNTNNSFRIDLSIWRTVLIINVIGVYLLIPLLELIAYHDMYPFGLLLEKIFAQLVLGGLGFLFIFLNSIIKKKFIKVILTFSANLTYFLLIAILLVQFFFGL